MAVIGAGYVGLTITSCWAHLGHRVVCVEKDPERVATMREGRVPFFEPGLDALAADGLARGAFSVTDAFADAVEPADVVFVAVGTPPRPSGEPDLSALDEVTDALARIPRRDQVVAIKSTVPVGTTDRMAAALRRLGAEAHLAHTPEFLAEGSAVNDFLNPSRVIIGTRSPVAERVLSALYGSLGGPVIVTDPCTSEMIKYASNAFLATKVSFINHIANLCEHAGADVHTVARGMGMDSRIGPHFLRAGVGFGGSCFPKDTRALISLSQSFGVSSALLDAVLDINEAQRAGFLDRMRGALGSLGGRRVAVFGLAFKGGTSDVRESPALDIAGRLVAAGAAVRAYDPAAEEAAAQAVPGLVCCPDAYEAAEDADAIAVLTDWSEFVDLDWERLRGAVRRPLLLDGRGLPIAERATAAGFTYVGPATPVGRAVPDLAVHAGARIPDAAGE
jgi:UDPglucose 6-dehydrogenase